MIGVGALIVAALGFVDSHRARHLAETERAQSARREAAGAPLILRGEADGAGRRVLLSPVSPAQVVQSQRYIFPRALLDHVMEVSAATPQIDREWIAKGLEQAYAHAHVHGVFEGGAPVGITTLYVENGATHRDASIYQVGYRITPGGLFGSPHAVLLGLALERRGVEGDLRRATETAWRPLG